MTEEFMELYMATIEENRVNRTAETRDNKAFLALVGYCNQMLEQRKVEPDDKCSFAFV